jgi:hypothetical protein
MNNLPDMCASWRQWRQTQRSLRLEKAAQNKMNKFASRFPIFGFFKKKEQTNGTEHNAGNH